MSKKLFVYGTLQDPEVQKKVIGRIVNSSPAKLSGFIKSEVVINNNTYPIIIKNPESSETISGLVLEIEPEDIKHLDEYETDAYKREKVALENDEEVWVYLKKNIINICHAEPAKVRHIFI